MEKQNKMVGVALRAEELRGKVAGYYIDRQIIKNKNGMDEKISINLNPNKSILPPKYPNVPPITIPNEYEKIVTIIANVSDTFNP